MAFLPVLLVDEYGYLTGGEATFPVDVIEHGWESTPYPPLSGIAEFDWEPGELGVQPGVFRHPEIRDWVCDETAWSVLSGAAGDDLHLIGAGDLDGKPLFVVQVITVLDIVDREESIIDTYPTYEILRFPAFRAGSEELVERRVFRVPGSFPDVFIGARIREELDRAGVTGFNYAPVPFAGDAPA